MWRGRHVVAEVAAVLIRVFPRRTSYTPRDPLAFVGYPPLIRPEGNEVHVSVVFTWDQPQAERLAKAWAQYYPTVHLGGPAYPDSYGGFRPGLYVRAGVTFTSRGCDNYCPWCLVPEREGPLRVLPIQPGHIVQDNNFLQCPREHRRAVYDMLQQQPRAAVFAGGIDARLVTDDVAGEFRGIRIAQLFLACDTDIGLEPLAIALSRLAWLGREKLRCYVLVGRESMMQAEARLQRVWELGAMPFAQLYQPPERWVAYSRDWRALARVWSRPAMMKSLMRAP